jgi:proline iminopeptidase
MVLRGIFMLRKKELDWFYQDGASNIFPEAWQKFLEPIEESKRDNLMAAYHKIFLGEDEEKKLNAAIAWSKWEGSTSSLSYNPDMANSFSDPKFALAFALIENHYFINQGFLDHENQLIESGIPIIRDIPTVIVQGRYDIVCPMRTAWELSQNWPEAKLIIAPSSGHTAFESEITHELIKATNTFSSSYE